MEKTTKMIYFAITPGYQFPLLLSLPSIPTPSSSYTNRPLWVRALLTSIFKKKKLRYRFPSNIRYVEDPIACGARRSEHCITLKYPPKSRLKGLRPGEDRTSAALFGGPSGLDERARIKGDMKDGKQTPTTNTKEQRQAM